MIKPWTLRVAALGLFMFAVSGQVLADPDIKLGKWETTVTSELEGMPFAPPPMTFTDCLTKEDLVPDMEPPDQQCDVMEHEVKGNTVSWRMRCQQDGIATRGQGEIRYSGETYRGEMTIIMSGGPMGEMKMKQTLQGRWLGACQ